MRKLFTGLAASVLAGSMALAGVMPTQAAPVMAKPSIQVRSDVVQVDHRRYHGGFYGGGQRYYRDGYRGNRGYYRNRNRDVGIGIGGAIAGALITGAIINSQQPRYAPAPRRVYRSVTPSHVNWCFDRWRSYDQYSNTYQPYNGPRRACISPYS